MKRISIFLTLCIYSISLNAAAGEEASRTRAYSITLAGSPCSSSTSPRDPISPRKPSPRVLQSVDESTLDAYEKILTSDNSERLRTANAHVDTVGVTTIDINYLIDVDTENYLLDPIAPYRLAYIEKRLGEALSQSKPDYKDRYSTAQTLTNDDLIKLVDNAAQGTLAERIFPYSYLEFMQVRHEKKDIEPDNLDIRSYATIAILVAAANRNLRANATYSMIRNHARQNEFLKESDEYLDAFYAELNRPRKGILPSSPKKKRTLRGLLARRSRHKRSTSAAQP